MTHADTNSGAIHLAARFWIFFTVSTLKLQRSTSSSSVRLNNSFVVLTGVRGKQLSLYIVVLPNLGLRRVNFRVEDIFEL